MYISEINHCLHSIFDVVHLKHYIQITKYIIKNSAFDHKLWLLFVVSIKLSYMLCVWTLSLQTYSFNTVHAWNIFYALDSPVIFVSELNWVSEETSWWPSQSVFLIVWAAPQRCCFQSQDTVPIAAFNSVNFQVLLAFVQTKHTEAVGWLSRINLLYHPKVRATVNIVTKSENSWARSEWGLQRWNISPSAVGYTTVKV